MAKRVTGCKYKPTDKNTHYYFVESPPDKEGKQTFTSMWWAYNPSLDKDGWRGQGFHAHLDTIVKNLPEGKCVKIEKVY